MKDLAASFRPAIVSLLVFTGLLGIVYPLLIGGIGAIAFPDQARGSLIHDRSGKILGSELVGQPFDEPAYFWSRPSALTANNAMTSSGANQGTSGFVDERGTLGPNPALVDAVKTRIQALRAADPGNTAKVPVDLVTASASGSESTHHTRGGVLPSRTDSAHTSRSDTQVRDLVEQAIEDRTLGVLGEPRVNVLRLNLELDSQLGAPKLVRALE